MPESRITARVKRVGDTFALIVPAREALRVGLREGRSVDIQVGTHIPYPLGVAGDLKYEPFKRDGLWPERV